MDATEDPAYPFVPLEHERLDGREMLARSRAFLALMQQRRTVRQFSDEPIPFELITNAILTAGTAPSGAHQQPWTFVVISDPETKRRIREVAEKEEWEFYHRRIPEEWRAALRPLGTDWVKDHITTAPHLIAVFGQAYGLFPDGTGGEKQVKHYYMPESVGIAVGYLLASLHHAGLVALTHTPSPMGFLRDVLGRPRNERAYLLIPVGYPAPGCRVPDIKRKSLEEIMVHFRTATAPCDEI
ncbi:MAG: nitroreductase family protein [Chloroflexota bacterium]